jgi:hypothetical protein
MPKSTIAFCVGRQASRRAPLWFRKSIAQAGHGGSVCRVYGECTARQQCAFLVEPLVEGLLSIRVVGHLTE